MALSQFVRRVTNRSRLLKPEGKFFGVNRSQLQGVGYATLGVSLFSLSLPMTHWALESYSPLFTATARAVIAGALAAIVLKIGGETLIPPGHIKEFIYTALGAVFGWPILIALALMKTQTAPVAVIASIMPLVTAVFAVTMGHERVPRQFWYASILGSAILLVFTSTRSSFDMGDLVADLLTIGAVISSSFCYVQGAALTKIFSGWKVISWVVILCLPITLPVTLWIWFARGGFAQPTTHAVIGMFYIGLSSMYIGFIPWYQGLKMVGSARGSQVQQLQVFMTLGWSAILLGETISLTTLICTLGIVFAVAWAIFSRSKVNTLK